MNNDQQTRDELISLIHKTQRLDYYNYEETCKATLNMFKILPEKDQSIGKPIKWFEGFKRGFIIIDQNANLVTEIPRRAFKVIDETFGSDMVRFNNTFFETYEKVENMTVDERICHQMLHYLTTYGAEMVGVKARTYIPKKDIKRMLPSNVDYSGVHLITIQLASEEEIGERVNQMVKTVVAPSDLIKNSFKILWPYMTCTDEEIKSFELQAMYYGITKLSPRNNIGFLRYMIYLTTGSPMIIKNTETVKKIKYSSIYMEDKEIESIIHRWQECDINSMAEIFNRYKPLFLAFKNFNNRELAPVINKIRRASDLYHKPLNTDGGIQNIVNLIRKKKFSDCIHILEKASNRELVKVINFLLVKINENHGDKRVYNIRNGKVFVDDVKISPINTSYYFALEYIKNMLYGRLKEVYKDIIFIIPPQVNYAAPTSEKQMSYNYPWGSIITIPNQDAFSVGIHWVNGKDGRGQEERTDLDLHVNRSDGTHYGWNSSFVGNDCIYSGDLTDAPRPFGASEAYWIAPENNETSYLMTVNRFKGPEEVDYVIFASRQSVKGDFIFDPSKSLTPSIPFRFNGKDREQTIGLVTKNKLTFYGGNLGAGIVPSGNYSDFIKGLRIKLENMCSLNGILNQTSTLLKYKDDLDSLKTSKIVIDLSPNNLDATTLLKVIDGTILNDISKKDLDLVDAE